MKRRKTRNKDVLCFSVHSHCLFIFFALSLITPLLLSVFVYCIAVLMMMTFILLYMWCFNARPRCSAVWSASSTCGQSSTRPAATSRASTTWPPRCSWSSSPPRYCRPRSHHHHHRLLPSLRLALLLLLRPLLLPLATVAAAVAAAR